MHVDRRKKSIQQFHRRRKEDSPVMRVGIAIGIAFLAAAGFALWVFVALAIGEKPGVLMVPVMGLDFAVETMLPWLSASIMMFIFGLVCLYLYASRRDNAGS